MLHGSVALPVGAPDPDLGDDPPDDARGDGPRTGPPLAALLGVLAVTAVLLPRLVAESPVVALALVVGLVASSLLLTHLGLCLGVLVAVSPFESIVDDYSPLVVKALGLLAFAAYALKVLSGAERRPPRHAGTGALLVFLLLVLAASTASPNGGDGLATTQRYLSFGLLAVALLSVMRHGRVLRRLVAVLVLASTIAAAMALRTFLEGTEARAGGPLDDPNDLAFVLAVSVPLAAALAASSSRTALRALYLGCIVVLLGGVAFTLSRGAALALVVLLLWAVAQRLVPPRAAVAGAVGLALLVGGVAVSSPELVDRALTQKSRIGDRNVDTRTLRWAAAARMTADHPLLGTGPSGFRLTYADYALQSRPDDETDVVAHQMYLEIAAELGLPALLTFLTLLGLAFRACRRTAAAPPGRAPPGDAVLAQGVFGGLLVTCTAALFLTEQYYLPLWVLVAAAFALELRLRPAAPSTA